jgi:SAM-dependent methyltransferase
MLEIENLNDYQLDLLLTAIQQKLLASKHWVFGPLHVRDTIQMIPRIPKFSIVSKATCEVGCGTNNPVGTSALNYINGASRAACFDLHPMKDAQRSCDSLISLLSKCMKEPEIYHFSDILREEYFDRVNKFDLFRLMAGDLFGGIKETAISYHVSSIYELDHAIFNNFDITYSRAVLEHVPDLDKACKVIADITRPGGCGIHMIDFVDHRFYHRPDRYHRWSFLTEGDVWQIGTPDPDISNRLRPAEAHACFVRAGFHTTEAFTAKEAIPDDIYETFTEKFKAMPREDLETRATIYSITK